ncbi:MAG: conjugal transfer protein TraF [Candidatus Schekmanbacteria bacterium]|nr:conjugal transfer protein TraF [Candidatus Schekmanbacteria bacterium]
MKKLLLSGFIFVFCSLLFLAKVQAEQWQIVGPRALGMGGAHVAVVNDATAAYWNPASYGFFGRGEKDKDEHPDKTWGTDVNFGVGVQLQGEMVKEVNDVLDYDFDALSTKADVGGITLADLDDFTKMVAEIKDLQNNKIGVNVMGNLVVAARIKNFGIGAYGLSELGADPNIDTVNFGITPTSGLETPITEIAGLGAALGGAAYTPTVLTPAQRATLIATIDDMDLLTGTGWTTAQATDAVNALDDALNTAGITSVSDQDVAAFENIAQVANNLVTATGGGGNLSDNNTTVLFKGAAVLEVPLTYGYAISDNLSIGGNLKYMQGVVYQKTIKVFDQDKDDFFKNAYDDYTRSSTFGVDLGLLAKLGDFRLGVVGRNLNTPEFDAVGSGKYQLDSQVRAGVAYMPAKWLTLALDADLLKNNTPFANFDSQNIGAGIELRVLNFLVLRGGIYNNIAMSNSDPVYTAGLGFNFWGVNLDLGAAVSSETSDLDGNKIPQEVRAEAAFSLQY